MKKIKLIFENEIDGKYKRFGYIINKDDRTYVTCQFDEKYEPNDKSETHDVGEINDFAKRMVRLIRYGLAENGDNGSVGNSGSSGKVT